jgi:hypothetical protein
MDGSEGRQTLDDDQWMTRDRFGAGVDEYDDTE